MNISAKEYKIIILGLDGTGKSTIAARMHVFKVFN